MILARDEDKDAGEGYLLHREADVLTCPTKSEVIGYYCHPDICPLTRTLWTYDLQFLN